MLIQNRVANQFRGVIVAGQSGVDDQVVKQRVVDIGVETPFCDTPGASPPLQLQHTAGATAFDAAEMI